MIRLAQIIAPYISASSEAWISDACTRGGVWFAIRMAFLGIVTGQILLATPKSESHERWRKLLKTSVTFERHFTPDEIGSESGALPPLPGKPAFLTRSLGALGQSEADKEWARMNLLTSQLDFSHNLSRVFSPTLYGEHPEFFPEEAGRRIQPAGGNVWWQPDMGRSDVARYAARAAEAFFTRKPDAVSFALGVNDGLVFGESAETKAFIMPVRWFRERPDYSNLVFTFMNRAAEELERTYPDKYLGALAYYWAENVPDFPVRAQVIPFLTADRSQGYDQKFLRQDRALQRRWMEAMRAGRATDKNGKLSAPPLRIGLYDYLYGDGFLIPRLHPHLLAKHLRYTRRLGFTDYYAEVYPNWGLDGPQPWLVAQLLQDPEQSADRLLNEYYQRYFKEAAKPMRRFFEQCERQWMSQKGPAYWLKHYRNESQATVFPSRVCAELRHFLNDAAKKAKSELVRARVQQVSDAFGVTERFIAMYEARDRLARSALADKPDALKLTQEIAAFAVARTEFTNYTKALQEAQPLLIAPFRLPDYLVNDPTAMAKVAVDVAESRSESGNPASGDWKKLPINGELSGPLKPARLIASLTYEVALPEFWQSRVEPAEHHRAKLNGGILRISGTKTTAVYRWLRLPVGTTEVRATAQVRGMVSNSGVVNLTLGWLDANEKHLGLSSVRLPEGEWPDWRTLLQAARPPEGAVWVGIGVTVMHQTPTDWIDAEKFALQTRP